MDAENHATGARTGISRHWLDVLEKNHVRFMALDPHHDGKLIEQLLLRPGWIVEFANEDAMFFVRKELSQAQ